jgi:hypothetical protein
MFLFSVMLRLLRVQGTALPSNGASREQHPSNYLPQRPDGSIALGYPEVRQRCLNVSTGSFNPWDGTDGVGWNGIPVRGGRLPQWKYHVFSNFIEGATEKACKFILPGSYG